MAVSSWAIVGVFLRIFTEYRFGATTKTHKGLGASSAGDLIVPFFFSNVFGSLIIGYMVGSPFDESNMPSLYTGITTGLCGAYTTFSSWTQVQSTLP
jgi:fluoride ion exporter CrcB/FEX